MLPSKGPVACVTVLYQLAKRAAAARRAPRGCRRRRRRPGTVSSAGAQSIALITPWSVLLRGLALWAASRPLPLAVLPIGKGRVLFGRAGREWREYIGGGQYACEDDEGHEDVGGVDGGDKERLLGTVRAWGKRMRMSELEG